MGYRNHLFIIATAFCLHMQTAGKFLVETKNEESIGHSLSSTTTPSNPGSSVGSDYGCGAGDFDCGGNECILSSQVCDRIDDCSDGSDERNCGTNPGSSDDFDYGCSAGDFDCGGNECILSSHVCDRIDDCSDGSDERNCRNKTRGCSDDEFDCGDNSCISRNKRCDGFQNCINAIDELNCPTEPNPTEATSPTTTTTENSDYVSDCGNGGYQCWDEICIKKSLLCNGIENCIDGDDELDCPLPTTGFAPKTEPSATTESSGTTSKTESSTTVRSTDLPPSKTTAAEPDCKLDEFRCSNGYCIPNRRACDRTDDCGDNSDENNCIDTTSPTMSKIMSTARRQTTYTTQRSSTSSNSCRHQRAWYPLVLLATVWVLIYWR